MVLTDCRYALYNHDGELDRSFVGHIMAETLIRDLLDHGTSYWSRSVSDFQRNLLFSFHGNLLFNFHMNLLFIFKWIYYSIFHMNLLFNVHKNLLFIFTWIYYSIFICIYYSIFHVDLLFNFLMNLLLNFRRNLLLNLHRNSEFGDIRITEIIVTCRNIRWYDSEGHKLNSWMICGKFFCVDP
jgi:hypothetical protein